MENKEAIIGQLLDLGYDFEDIIKAFEKSSDTAEMIKFLENLKKKTEMPRESVRFVLMEPKIDQELNKGEEVKETENGLGVLIEFCKKKSRSRIPDSNFHRDFKSVVYVVETYKDI